MPLLVQAAYGSEENNYAIEIPDFVAQHGTQLYIFVSPDTPVGHEETEVIITINGGNAYPIALGTSFYQYHEIGEPVLMVTGRAFAWGILHVVFYDLGGELLPIAINLAGTDVLANNALSRTIETQHMQGGVIYNDDATVPNSTGYAFRGRGVFTSAGTTAVSTRIIRATRKCSYGTD